MARLDKMADQDVDAGICLIPYILSIRNEEKSHKFVCLIGKELIYDAHKKVRRGG